MHFLPPCTTETSRYRQMEGPGVGTQVGYAENIRKHLGRISGITNPRVPTLTKSCQKQFSTAQGNQESYQHRRAVDQCHSSGGGRKPSPAYFTGSSTTRVAGGKGYHTDEHGICYICLRGCETTSVCVCMRGSRRHAPRLICPRESASAARNRLDKLN